MHIGNNIKKIRQLKGYSQQGIADKICKTRALVSFIETTGNVNQHTLTLFAKVFKMSVEDIELFETNHISNSTLQRMEKENRDLKKENEMLKELVDSQRKIIELMSKKKK